MTVCDICGRKHNTSKVEIRIVGPDIKGSPLMGMIDLCPQCIEFARLEVFVAGMAARQKQSIYPAGATASEIANP